MLERRARGRLESLVCGSLCDLIADDHVLVRVDRVLEMDWLHPEAAELRADGVGRPAVESEAVGRLVLAGFLPGLVHDRRLMGEAQVDIALRPSGPCAARVRPLGGRVRAWPGAIFTRIVRDCAAADSGAQNAHTFNNSQHKENIKRRDP